MSGRLYLFRHGRAAPFGCLIGQADHPLSPEGEEQARFWRDRLAGITFSAAWSSPLSRARRTGAIILSGNPSNTSSIIEVETLREISLGLWEGRDKGWIRRHYPLEWEARGKDVAGTPPPGGESFSALAERVLPPFAALCREAARHEHSLLVAHQAVNRVILASILGLPLQRVLEIAQAPAALTVLELTEQGPRVLGCYEAGSGEGIHEGIGIVLS